MLNAVATKGPSGLLGMFNAQTAKPVANAQASVGASAAALAVPTNTTGLGLFNTIMNSAPFATLKTSGGAQPVQYNSAVKGGLAPVSGSLLSTVAQIGLPVSLGAQPAQAAGLVASGYGVGINTSGSNNTLMYLGLGLIAGKAFKLF